MKTRARHAPRWIAVGALGIACGSGVRTVPTGPHAMNAAPPMVVGEVPPPSKVEMIPKDPGEPCAWLDGRWEWVEQEWEWTPGMWLLPPSGCHFSPPETVWVPSAERGLLFYLSGRWYPDKGTAACEVARPCGSLPPGAP